VKGPLAGREFKILLNEESDVRLHFKHHRHENLKCHNIKIDLRDIQIGIAPSKDIRGCIQKFPDWPLE
jgi:hypothetical protein